MTWTRRHSGTLLHIAAIAYGAGQFVGVGGSGPKFQNPEVLTSPDGITWTKRTTGSAAYLGPIAYGAGQFVAVGGRDSASIGNQARIWTSPDGINWTKRRPPTDTPIYAITYAAGKFVAVGKRVILTSTDTDIWEQRNKP